MNSDLIIQYTSIFFYVAYISRIVYILSALRFSWFLYDASTHHLLLT